jgi:phosphoribosylamine--glycine ligase
VFAATRTHHDDLHATTSTVIRPSGVAVDELIAAGSDAHERDRHADLNVNPPEAPHVAGAAVRLRAHVPRVLGPGAAGARLEGSKAWMKEVVAEAGVPTARHAAFVDVEPALDFLRSLPPPYVVKTDGLAAGKGVLVTESLFDAEEEQKAKLGGVAFGDAGRSVVIEEGMAGPELSLLAVCDGHRAVALAPAQDFKRIYDRDKGPNTGGMGAYSPVPFADDKLIDIVLESFIAPTLAALRDRGIDYRGTLYAGLMLTDDGPKLVEYNVRFGDPEAQVVLPRLSSDLYELLVAAADGDLRAAPAPTFVDDAAVCVVAAAAGYPGQPQTGQVIDGTDADLGDALLFFAGVARDADGRLVTSGGRVLDVVGTGPTIAAARARAYEALTKVTFAGMQFRHDIAATAAKEDARDR